MVFAVTTLVSQQKLDRLTDPALASTIPQRGLVSPVLSVRTETCVVPLIVRLKGSPILLGCNTHTFFYYNMWLSTQQDERSNEKASLGSHQFDDDECKRHGDDEGSQLSAEWKTFVQDNDFDVSIVQKLKKAKSYILSSKAEKQVRAGILVGALLQPNFTEDHAKEALEILFPELEEPKSNHRGPSIVDGLDTKLVHTLDLKAFGERIENLFLWHTNSAISMKYRAPYFSLVQSSGMGKTKLFQEFRDRYNQQEGQHCQTILCLDVHLSSETRHKFFDHQLVQTTDTIVETVFERMDSIIRGFM